MTSPSPAVLLVAEGGDAGGIGRYCVDLAGMLGERAAVVCLCPAPCASADGCWLAAQCAQRGIPLDVVPMPPKGWRAGLAGLVGLWRASGRPLLHVNGRRGNAVALSARLLYPSLRYVTTVHGVLGLHDRRNAIYRLVDLAAGWGARAIIAVSVDTRRRLLRAGSPRGRTHVVLNALAAPDLAVLRSIADARTQRNQASGPLRIGFLGRLSAEKGTRELLEAASILHASGVPATFAIGGDGPDRPWMVAEAKSHSEAGFVSFHGEVRDAAQFLAGIDVLVIPSRNEGLPYVLLEAMAAGCAIVAFEVGGIPEVVSDSSLGVLVKPGDVDGLATALARLSADRGVVSDIGRAASAQIARHHTLELRLPDLARIYGNDVLGSLHGEGATASDLD